MQHIFTRFLYIIMGVFSCTFSVQAQEPTSVDPALLELQTSRIPREYTISSITVSGAHFLDTAIVVSITGLQVGDKVVIPGGDNFSRAINNLWRQRLFSNVQIYITDIQGDNIAIEINVQERPRLGEFTITGIPRGQQEELRGKVGLTRGVIVTENSIRNAIEAIEKFYREKGYLNINVRVEEKADPALPNTHNVNFHVDRGRKIRVNQISFYGNEEVTELKLKGEMKGTNEMSKITLRPVPDVSPYGENQRITFGEYVSELGFLSFSKTRHFLEPYFRFKLFSSSKFDPVKYEEDKENIVNLYNSLGYRDAYILEDTIVTNVHGNLNIAIRVDEGNQYHFGNIAWRGNTKYSDSLLTAILGIRKGEIYNVDRLNKRLGKQLSMEGGDISGLYMDDGYLFFRVDPIETAVYNDTIDFEIRVVEGPQATIRNVGIFGNEKTKDYVIRRELRTVPGEKFSRADLIRSQRELAQLQYFNQETINPGVVPNQEDGTVDINWNLEEKSSDQLELSAGWGGGIGLTGTLGVSFNNFSVRNIFNKETWNPLPTGDGQKLSIRFQSNGRAFRSYNFSFTEPWLGGKRRNSLTFSFFNSKFANAFDPLTGMMTKERADNSFLRTLGVSASLGRQLRWPDDFFSLVYSLSYTQYDLKNYQFQGFGFNTGTSTNVALKIALQRSSVFNPQYPTSGSNMVASVQMTPPYSLFNPSIITAENQFRNPEYHKWRFNAEWFVPIGKPTGADRNRQLVLKVAAKYGFMGRYNNQLDFSPFERFQVGGDGLTNNFGLLGFDIISLRGYPVFESSNPAINPDLNMASRYFTMFNKYQLELRYPLVVNPGTTIYGLTFFDAANGWYSFKDYNPFKLRRSVGVGMRFFLPMFGMLGFDYGIGLDRLQPGDRGLKGATRFTFMLGFEPE